VYVIPEVVLVYVWQLGATKGNAERSMAGCKHIAHNFYLSHSNGVDVPSTHVIRPYITPSIVQHADESPGTRENLVLIDNDTPSTITSAVQRICRVEGSERISTERTTGIVPPCKGCFGLVYARL
jgi:hypothetical protein